MELTRTSVFVEHGLADEWSCSLGRGAFSLVGPRTIFAVCEFEMNILRWEGFAYTNSLFRNELWPPHVWELAQVKEPVFGREKHLRMLRYVASATVLA